MSFRHVFQNGCIEQDWALIEANTTHTIRLRVERKKTKNCLEIHFSFECRKLDRNVIVFSRFDSPRARKPVVREGPLSSRKCRHELLILHTAWLGANRNKIFLLKFESLFIYLDTFRLTGRIE